jgi:bacteriocin biosynthesis cyclodehydratase domain-containing protein
MLLKPWVREAQDGDRVLLQADGFLASFDGPGVRKLMPDVLALLDGSRTRDAIVSEFDIRAQAAVSQLLTMLEEQRLVVEVDAGTTSERGYDDASLEHLIAFAGSSELPANALSHLRVAVLGESSTALRIRELLSASGVLIADRNRFDGFSFVVAAPAAEDVAALSDWNREALRAETPWLPVVPFDGHDWSVGPLIVPHETCCFECYRTRHALTLEYAADAPLVDVAPSRSRNMPAVDAIIAGIAATSVWRWLVFADAYLPGIVHCLSLSAGFRLAAHEVRRVPRCPACWETGTTARVVPWHDASAT